MVEAMLFSAEFQWQQTNMRLKSDSNDVFERAKTAVLSSRSLLEQYIIERPDFATSLEPLELDQLAPEFIRNMMKAGLVAGVGPMAAVAGGLSEVATEAMIATKCNLALAENGGDISIKGNLPVTIGVYAGESMVANKLAFKISATDLPLGVCTSAGALGHSLSLGESDAVIVFSSSAFISDAAATAVGNLVKLADPEGSIQTGLERAETIDGVLGCMIICQELVGTTGKIPEMVEVVDSKI